MEELGGRFRSVRFEIVHNKKASKCAVLCQRSQAGGFQNAFTWHAQCVGNLEVSHANKAELNRWPVLDTGHTQLHWP